jgi:hypothetical protein bfra3_11636
MKTQNTDRKLPITAEEAYAMTGAKKVDFSNVPEDKRAFIAAVYDMTVVVEAANDGWKADWDDVVQLKCFPSFDVTDIGVLCFSSADYYYTFANAGNASHLVCRDEATAAYVGRQFIDLWNTILKGK